MRRSRSAVPHLNAAAILAAAGADYPDRELLDAIQHGVHMPTDFQMLIVLNPGLLSLADGMPQLAADVARVEAAGMLTVHTFLPFVPGVLFPQGTTGKQNEQTLRRRIMDAGAPRAPLTSRDGTEVVPINEGVRTPLLDGRSRMQPEEKPASNVTVNDACNLAYVARAMALDGFAPDKYLAYLACDDFKAFFNQFVLHPSEWSRFCLAFLCDGDLYVASERVLGFGCAPSSGIAQRFAYLVRTIVTERMIATNALFVADLRRRAGKHLLAWFAQRDALSAETGLPQALFFHISIYTDDAGQGAVGCARMKRFLEVWTVTCEELGIECAAAHKRSLGTFVLSLCVVLCHTLRGFPHPDRQGPLLVLRLHGRPLRRAQPVLQVQQGLLSHLPLLRRARHPAGNDVRDVRRLPRGQQGPQRAHPCQPVHHSGMRPLARDPLDAHVTYHTILADSVYVRAVAHPTTH
jgi:hypothetical protein